MATANDADIEALDLDEAEKWGLQLHRNYTKAFQRRRAEKIGEEASNLKFDFDGFEAYIDAIIPASLEHAILAAVAVADQLLVEMFQRERRERLKVADLLGPLGPLGDFNKRLKVAALADLIDEDDLTFFDELRKLRNRIAHSPHPSPPTGQQVKSVINSAPEWLDTMIEEYQLPDVDRTSERTLKAAIILHLAKLAWGTLLRPLARRADVPLMVLLEKPRRPAVFVRFAKLGVYRAEPLLRPA